ncbi:MAG: crotonase/enoyl-CoA hydratase family protein [Pseudomonadota bacterium]
MAETLRIETDDQGVATLWLTRAAKHNAMNAAMIAELSDACATLAADKSVRAVVLAAEGASFCAGGDLAWMQDQIASNAAERAAGARRLAAMLGALDTLPKPLIGRVQGQAFGGGIGLISVCDIAVGSAGARFALTEVKLGIIPATISPYVIKRIGEPAARRMMMSGRVFDSAGAAELGFLHRVVAPADLDAAVGEEVAPFLRVAPGALARTKQLIAGQGGAISAARIEASIEALVAAWEDPEAQAGIAAFFAKEKPPWG